ncbi:AraC-like DNA-binding protein [Rhizobium rosettiformans]|uniref:AraC family transcriptional regulator n=2 Tax=Rhizobium rosettiformans TaxID=1368430 RepID=A0A4S8Q5G6_9HYPH|nr:AraC family transcriptional regulator [Rhizobium rosettiformans]MBB5274464.1 AraC-like DNA-binding protein [Rhizobium rosettiformans]THV37922.1 AraC family transcriptional regulator [Rhizobium rosettiformans W3]
MRDPLSDVIALLKPRTVFSKGISGAGRWAVHYASFGQPGFCAITKGRCRFAVDGEEPVILEEGDFLLLPATPAFTMGSIEPAPPVSIDPTTLVSAPDGEKRHGRPDGEPDMRQFGGYFSFDAPDASLFVSLLPRMIHVRGAARLTQLVHLLGDEARRADVGRDLILERYAEILLIEALRSVPAEQAPPGLLRGLAEPRIALALQSMHAQVDRPWTVEALARLAAMSRSAFFDRFRHTVGLRPMEYLMTWRMALAKDLLRHQELSLDAVAEKIGYGSASTFSTAFSRHVGVPPGRFAKTASAAR